MEKMTFDTTGTFVDRRLPVDSVDPVLMARQDRLQGHGEAPGHICSRAKELNDYNSTDDKQHVQRHATARCTHLLTGCPPPPPLPLVSLHATHWPKLASAPRSSGDYQAADRRSPGGHLGHPAAQGVCFPGVTADQQPPLEPET